MYTISKFSRISRLSTKMLRHYDRIGLLKPCRIDSKNSYRYYDSKQIKDIIVINKMKAYGFSLEEIKSVLSVNDNKLLDELIKGRINELKIEIMHRNHILNGLKGEYENFLKGTDIFNRNRKFNIVIDEQKPLTVLGVRYTISMENIQNLINRAYENTCKYGLKQIGHTITICYDEDFDPFYADVEVCIPVDKELKTKNLCTRAFGGGLHVHTIFTGPSNYISEGYAALCDWMDSEGYEQVGAPFEKCIKGLESGCSIDEYITEIYFPVKKVDIQER